MFSKNFDYKSWADIRTLAAIEKIDRSAYPQSYSFVLQQINHIVIVDELFRSRLEKNSPPHEATNTDVVPAYEELKTRLIESGKWYANFVANLEPGKERTNISFKFADGKLGTMSIEEMLFHVVNHGSYHRGSIAHALDLASVAHPADGYGIFVHQEEPSRRNISIHRTHDQIK